MATSRPAEITARMVKALSIAEPDLDTSIGTPIRKILDTVGEAIAEASLDNYLQSYQYDIDTRTGSDLDAFVGLFGFARRTARRASGSLILQRSIAAPYSIVIPAGSQAANADGTTIVQTISNNTFPTGSTSIEVVVESVAGGAAGNASAGSLVRWITPVSGITAITNPQALAGGMDAESDEQLKTRFKATLFRNLAGTEAMYAAIALDDDSTINARVLGPSTIWSERIETESGTGPSSISPLDDPMTVRGATNATPVVIATNAPHHLAEGDVVWITGVGGNTSANGLRHVGTTPTTTTFSLRDLSGDNVVAAGAYTSGGTVYKVARLAWSDPESSHFGTNLALGEVAAPHLYTFSGDTTFPTITVDTAIYPDGVYDLDFLYESQATRNNHVVTVGAQNKVDVWVDGSAPTSATETTLIDGATLFAAGDAQDASVSRYRREDGSQPVAGNIRVPLTFIPVIDLPDGLSVGSVDLLLGTDYWLVRDVRNSRYGSPDSLDAIEVSASSVQTTAVAITSSTNASPIVLTIGTHDFQEGQYVLVEDHATNTAANGLWRVSAIGGTTVTLENSVGEAVGGATGTVRLHHPIAVSYTMNATPRNIQRAIEDWRLVTTDVSVHAARPVNLRLHVAAILRPGFSVASVQAPMERAISSLMDTVGIGGVLQVSDVLNVMGDTTGVDAVRFLNSSDASWSAITAATNATPIVLTIASGHGLVEDDLVQVHSVGGNTAANGVWRVEAADATTVTLLGSDGNSNYTSGGAIAKADWAWQIIEDDGTTIRTTRTNRDAAPYRAMDIIANDNERFVLHSIVITPKAQNLWGVQ